jgi:DNA-binding PadR family transcriptional regulator
MSKIKQFSQPGLPLTPPVFYILLSLGLKERHGYDIIKQVQQSSGGAVRLGPGTLYTTIKRLVAEGLIVEVTDRPAADNDDPRRRYYRLTERGSQILATELRRLERAVALAQQGQLFSGAQAATTRLAADEHE